ncbi:MAG: trimethylamine methyltransferase family protein [Bacillota bacterium]
MQVNRLVQTTLGLNLMTEAQLQRVHYGTLTVLERTGVKVHEKEALQLLREAGAKVEGELVKIPPHLVQKALETAPPVVSLYGRDGKRALTMKKNSIYYGTGSEVNFTIDLDTGERRKPVKQDNRNAAFLVDALDHTDFAMSLGVATDVPVGSSDVHQFEAMLTSTTKPILFTAYNRRGLEHIIEMAGLAVGGKEILPERPNLALYAEPSSPLMHSRDSLEKLLTCAAEGIPLIYATTPMLGATAPVTMSGALVVASAEILSGLVIHQLKSEGAPFVYGGGIPPMHMATSICSYGAPERDRGCIALVKMSQYYNLPSFTTAGCSDAHSFDQQAGMEAGFNLLIAGLAGGNLIHNLGYIGVGMTSCLEHLLLCNEAVGAVKNLLRGVDVSDEHLALDLIDRVGPAGHFLSEPHTMEHFRNELYFPKVLNRKNYDVWQAEGGLTFGQLANRKVKEILNSHEPVSLPGNVRRQISEISLKRDREVINDKKENND